MYLDILLQKNQVMSHKVFYRRRLPHIQPEEGDFSITYRLYGSLPKSIIKKLSEEYEIKKFEVLEKYREKFEVKKAHNTLREEYFQKVEYYLDQATNGPTWLREKEVAAMVMDSLKYIEENFKYWTIWSYCIMPNHVHLECTLNPGAPPLCKILQLHKSYTAVQANRYLGRSGRFWMEENFDRLIRDENDFYKRVFYTIGNPVNAKLVEKWDQWPYTYLHPEIRKAEL
jgi:REP element-mobilizing transposase RayT